MNATSKMPERQRSASIATSSGTSPVLSGMSPPTGTTEIPEWQNPLEASNGYPIIF